MLLTTHEEVNKRIKDAVSSSRYLTIPISVLFGIGLGLAISSYMLTEQVAHVNAMQVKWEKMIKE